MTTWTRVTSSANDALTQKLSEIRRAQDWNSFQRFAIGLLSRSGYRNVNPSYHVHDGGADAQGGMLTPCGEACFPVVSLTHTLKKIREDCASYIGNHQGHTEKVVVFMTLGPERGGLTYTAIQNWEKAIASEFGLKLVVHQEEWIRQQALATSENWFWTCRMLGISSDEVEYAQKCEHVTRGHLSSQVMQIPMLGRLPRREVATVHSALGTHDGVLLRGEAGVGKSGVVTEVAEILIEQGWVVLVPRIGLGGLSQWSDIIIKLARCADFCLILDQADNLSPVGQSDAYQLVHVAISAGAKVVLVMRDFTVNTDPHVNHLAFHEVIVSQLDEQEVRLYLEQMGVAQPSGQLVELARTILNLSLVADIVASGGSVEDVHTDHALWERFRQCIETREGSDALAWAVRVARECARLGTLESPRPLPVDPSFTKLESMGMLVPTSNSQRLRFRHAEMRDFLVAWNIVARHLDTAKSELANVHITVMRGVMAWIGRIALTTGLTDQVLETVYDV